MSNLGKSVGRHVYIHVSLAESLDPSFRDLIAEAIKLAADATTNAFNVFKINREHREISLLDYANFFEEAFPALRQAWTVDLEKGSVRYRTYENSLNPPILHRKELLIPEDHSQRAVFANLTTAAEQIGLFDDPNRIGFKQAWGTLLEQRGYRLAGHDLVPIGNDDVEQVSEPSTCFNGVARHLTALTRYGFSAPIQTLARFGFLDGTKTVFDYGCGRGDDLRGLLENGIDAAGWDPHYAQNNEKRRAHLVNLGFVINVIENLEERVEAINGAFKLADELLIVSAMIANQDAVKGTPYGDGVLTTRNTFQKYFTQGELQQFIAEALREEPLPVGPGIFYVFKDKDAEQRFMYGRQENRRNILRLTRLSRPDKPARVDRLQAKFEQHHDLLEALWDTCLMLGRDPTRDEVESLASITEHFGSLPAALRFIKSRKENVDAILEEARQSRTDDLRVYFAQLQFQKRRPYRHLENRLQKDIREFFGDYRTASESGRQLLFSISSTEAINTACREAAEHGIGWLEEGESLQLHTSLVEQLPPLLRTYIDCGTVLYGNVSSADVIKIHIRSGKLTLMNFDDFTNKPLPRMIKRVKLNLRNQGLDIFDYGEAYETPYLYRKSRFINEEFPRFSEQVAFEDTLEALNLLAFTGYGPAARDFDQRLEQARWEVNEFQLVRSTSIPDLDASCGRYLTYRQLIECGETQSNTGLPNLPKEPDTYTALYDLAVNVLDPVIDYFGMIKITYGFCSLELGKHIKKGVAPILDQHSAHERKGNGKFVCERLGAACDFLIEDEDMKEVATWIYDNTGVDRIYYYGPDLPIHVSYSGKTKSTLVHLVMSSKGKQIPRVIV